PRFFGGYVGEQRAAAADAAAEGRRPRFGWLHPRGSLFLFRFGRLVGRLRLGDRVLERETDSLSLLVHAEYADLDRLCRLHDVAHPPDPLRRELRDMNQPFDTGLQFDERPDVEEPRDRAGDVLARNVLERDLVPRVGE